MARQEEVIAQTIANMKRAMLRKPDDSESDDSIKKQSNRGNKLKRKAKFVEEGRLDQANNIKASRRRINYNGYFREVISRNPMRVDHDGDVVDNEDDDSTLELEDFEDDPYGDVHIESLLRPLTSAADLKAHPTLSLPYTSKILDEMLYHAQDMVFREEDALWKIKTMTGEFHGDSTWMPTGTFEQESDPALLGPTFTATSIATSDVGDGDLGQAAMPSWNGLAVSRSNTDMEDAHTDLGTTYTDGSEETMASFSALSHDAYEAPVLKMPADRNSNPQINGSVPHQRLEQQQSDSHPASGYTENGQVNGVTKDATDEAVQFIKLKQEDQASTSAESEALLNTTGTEGVDAKQSKEPVPELATEPLMNGDTQDKSMEDVHEEVVNEEEKEDANNNEEETPADDNAHAPHRMTTRAKAQAATSSNPNSPQNPSSPSHNTANFIHPFFIPPRTAMSTREFGIPPEEADETRRLLCAYVQKQEEVCRSVNRIWDGLMKAQRLRNDVLEWCQAEGHIGEMSDGEDWYDRDKWGLEQDLKKGEELDEEDANVTGKKTRHRRTARDA